MRPLLLLVLIGTLLSGCAATPGTDGGAVKGPQVPLTGISVPFSYLGY